MPHIGYDQGTATKTLFVCWVITSRAVECLHGLQGLPRPSRLQFLPLSTFLRRAARNECLPPKLDCCTVAARIQNWAGCTVTVKNESTWAQQQRRAKYRPREAHRRFSGGFQINSSRGLFQKSVPELRRSRPKKRVLTHKPKKESRKGIEEG
ncbi:hypothetical protein SKAU_G00038820 [Synaphobranchus kaupii]|uniref:Uncharacterized protein n=1 Tax=Synaphobranchus kaupii TaxID=118154 RepID=A0A9Q1GFA5_SYNKA|nr:hypothetical protein SKAU_G00038820 [Synaphobranchus kaupii]